MAYAVQLTIGTGNKVSINYQSQEVSVSLTYQLEREDADVLAIAQDKAGEVAAAHRIAWERIRDEKVNGSKVGQSKSSKKKGHDSNGDEPDGGELESEELSSESSPIRHDLPAAGEVALEVKEEDRVSDNPVVPLTGGQLAALEALLVQGGWSQSQLEDHLLDQFGKAELVELSAAQAAQMLLQLQRDERLKTQSRSQERRNHPARLNGHS